MASGGGIFERYFIGGVDSRQNRGSSEIYKVYSPNNSPVSNLTSQISHSRQLLPEFFLGIGDAKALSVHLANPRVTKERRRRWTGLAVALIVACTVCDAQQIGLSSSDGLLLRTQNLVSGRVTPTEQKAPPVLAPSRVSDQALAARLLFSGASRPFASQLCFRYALRSVSCALNTLSPQPNSGESTRGPPRETPTFCQLHRSFAL